MSYYHVYGLLLSFIVDDEQQEFLLDSGFIESDGRTVWYTNTNGHRYESITTPNVVDAALAQGLISEFHPIHEKLAAVADRFNGTISREGWKVRVETHLQATLRMLARQDSIFSCHCPIDVRIGTDPNRPGSFFWYFVVLDPNDILWVSMHKALVDIHFPVHRFLNGRPELPDYSEVQR